MNQLSPLSRLLAVLLTVAASSLWYHIVILSISLAVVLAIAALERVLRTAVMTAGRLMLFGMLLVLPLPFIVPGQVVADLPFGLHLYDAGLWRAVVLLLRLAVATVSLSWLLNTVHQAALLEALRRMRVPAVFVSLIGMMLRYMQVLGEEVRRLKMARQARGGNHQKGARQTAASILGVLLARSALRGERVYLALLARGFGRLDKVAPPFNLKPGEYMRLGGLAFLCAIVTYVDFAWRGGPW